jgi:hypothetical protein
LIFAEVDWVSIAGVATAVGTLVLAVATFGATRSANRAARTAERSLLIGLRPVLVPSREGDPAEAVLWGDGHQIMLAGGVGWAEVVGDNVYLAISVRNVGPGLGVLRGWYLHEHRITSSDHDGPDPDAFRRQLRDLYVPSGDVSFWQASLRTRDDDVRVAIKAAIERGNGISVDLLYGDHEGGQPTISRFSLVPREGEPKAAYLPTVVRHWRL